MKKIILILTICLAANFGANAQYVNIPDSNFRSFLEKTYPSCFNSSHQMDTTCSAVVNETLLDCSVGKTITNIYSFDGIQYFKNLNTFDCQNHQFITSLPRLPDSLKIFVTAGCTNLHCLPRLPSKLEYLEVDEIQIACIPNYVAGLKTYGSVSGVVLINLPVCNATYNPNSCPILGVANPWVIIPDNNFGDYLINKYPSCLQFDNSINKYKIDTTCSGVVNELNIDCKYLSIKDISGIEYFKHLKNLDFGYNFIDSVKLLPQSIRTISFDENPIKIFPVLNDSVEYISMSVTGITHITSLPKNLKHLFFELTPIDTFPALPNGLIEFSMHRPGFVYPGITKRLPLSKIPTLPNSLEILELTDGIFTTIPPLPNSIKKIVLTNLLISSIPNFSDSLTYLYLHTDSNLNCLPQLPNTLTNLILDTTLIHCLPNIPSGLTTTLPICNATNNPNNCPILGVASPWVIIPDNNFGWFLQANYPTCLAYDSAISKYKMDTTCSGVVNATGLMDCSGIGINSLEGVRYFKSLSSINAGGNPLNPTQNLPDSLKELYLDFCGLTSFTYLPTTLRVLGISANPIVSLPNLPATLVDLGCYANPNLISLPTLPNGLQKLIIDRDSSLKCLPKLPASLILFNVSKGGIGGVQCLPNIPAGIAASTTLPVCNATYNPNSCPTFGVANPWVIIPDSAFGVFLKAKYPTCLQFNSATKKYKMDTTCASLITDSVMNCNNLKIHSLYGIQYFNHLIQLSCSYNSIDSLLELPNTIKSLFAESNHIKFIDQFPSSMQVGILSNNALTNIPNLPVSCTSIYLDNNQLASLSIPTNCNTKLVVAGNNNLTAIISLPTNTALELYVKDNPSLKCLPILPSGTTGLDATNTAITCLPNKPSGLSTTLPICNTTNNPNSCQIFSNPYVNIPDTNLGKFLLTYYPTCLYKSNVTNKYYMDTTCSEIVNEKQIICNNLGIADLTGVQYFKSLTSLWCYGNNLTSLPNLTNSLKDLNCNGNQLTYLPVLGDSLNTLWCNYNKLVTLPILPKQLGSLECGNNLLTTLPILPKQLQVLSCGNNLLTSLPTVLPDSLQGLFCRGNLVNSLPTLPNVLKYLSCDSCNLSILNPLPDSLIQLTISKNNIHCLPKLPKGLQFILFDTAKIKCLPNIPSGLSSTYPVCNPTNNANQCQSFPYIYGRVFTDNNSNGVKDANEFYCPFVKINSNTGDETFSNINGKYVITLDSIGSYTLKATAPQFYKAVPDSSTVNFSNYNSVLGLPDIALQPIVTKDSFAVKITRLNRPRPGFNCVYNVSYTNVGTVSSATTNFVNFYCDTSKLHIDSVSTVIMSTTNNNAQVTVDAGNLVAGQGGSFNLYCTVKSTVNIGDTLIASAGIIYSATKTVDGDKAVVTGSYDPNDKTATPTLSPAQVLNGDKIEYTIRFQNTGNDTAVNVVISDTLSNLLQSGYLQVVSTSHPNNTTYKILNNIFYFEFLNINLPDSATNKFGSMGWITFRAKPLSTVALGTTIDNKAYIYFDYNKHIITNVARTVIKNIVTPVKITKYEVRATNEKQVLNNWTVANEVNVSHYNVQRSVDGKTFTTVGQVKANGNTTYNFTDPLTSNNLPLTIYYRLQIVDNDGRTDYSAIKQIRLNQLTNQLINVYPNPAKGIVNIDCANAKEIRIVDYLGRAVFNKKAINTQLSTINVQQFNKGIYIVQVVLNNGTVMNEKLIIE